MLLHYNFHNTYSIELDMSQEEMNTTQLQNKELHDMVVEIANYCKNKEVEGISMKKKLTSTGGKYKWTDGEEIKENKDT